jgi:hypothetical protein
MASSANLKNEPEANSEKGDAKETTPMPELRHCAYCLKQFKGLKTCGKCKRRAYCSVECQRKDWKPLGSGQGHKV